MDAAFAPEDLLAHSGFIRSLARSLLGDEHAAEDVLQETARAVLERPPRTGGALRPWLGTLARNFALRRRRGEIRRLTRERGAARPEAQPGTDLLLERAETLRLVVEAVSTLPEPYRACVLLRYYEGLPPRAIAPRLGLPVETVRSRLRRALDALRERLARDLAERPQGWRAALGLVVGCGAPEPQPAATLGIAVLLASGAALAGLALFGLRGMRSSPAAPDPAGVGLASAGVAAPELAALEGGGFLSSERAPVLGLDAGGALLAGRVLDETGAGVPGIEVYVLAASDPFGEEHPAPAIGWNEYRGRVFPSGADGSWSAELPVAQNVLVAIGCDPGHAPVPGPGGERWVDAPAEGVDFVVRSVPTAILEVRALVGATREELHGFGVSAHGDPGPVCEHRPGAAAEYTLGFYTFQAERELARRVVPVPVPEGISFHVTLSETGQGPVPPQRVHVRAGETHELVFVLGEGGIMRGHVVDPLGNPIEGALVFFGDPTTGRGDEPFQPFRVERVPGAVRTAPDGWFELPGSGGSIGAWHPDHSPATLDPAGAGRIVLGPRGAIRGRVLDAAGNPRSGVEVTLDDRERGLRARTDEAGAFAFEQLEAGVHGLFVERDLTSVRLAAGEELALELGPAQGTLALELVQAGEPFPVEHLSGIVLGLDALFDLREVETESSSLALIEGRVRSGRYLLLSFQGWTAPFVVAGERAQVELGAAELLVRARPSQRMQLVPDEADWFTRLMAARLPCRAGDDGLARFRVQPGRYALVGERGATLAEVEVPAGGAAIELP